MSDPLDALKGELNTSIRDSEYLDFDASGWSDADKARARALLMDHARAGDERVPDVLAQVCTDAELVASLEELLRSTPPKNNVRVRAAMALTRRLGRQAELALKDAIVGGTDPHTMGLAINLLLQLSGEVPVRTMLYATKNPLARRALVDALWAHRHLDLFPSRHWTGLGLLKERLSVPLDSFQAPAIPKFFNLLDAGTPQQAGYAPVTDGLPDRLKAAQDDVRTGNGPIPQALLQPLGPDEREALEAFAAKQALAHVPRGVEYVAELSNEEHRDLFEWAAALPEPAMAAAGRHALDGLP